MTRDAFHRFYDDWGVDDRLTAEIEAATTAVPGERIIVVGFPLGAGIEWTLRLESDRLTFAADVRVVT